MIFPKKTIDELQKSLGDWLEAQNAYAAGEQAPCPAVDPKDLEDLITYAELANARIKELEDSCSGLMFKLRCVAQALK